MKTVKTFSEFKLRRGGQGLFLNFLEFLGGLITFFRPVKSAVPGWLRCCFWFTTAQYDNNHSQEYANKEYILRERPKFMGYPGRFYRQWEVTFSSKKKGAPTFLKWINRGRKVFFSAKKKRRRVFFCKEKKRANRFFGIPKEGETLFYKGR